MIHVLRDTGVDGDAEDKDVEQRYVAAVVEFQVEVRGRLEVHTGVEAVIVDYLVAMQTLTPLG